MEYPGLNARALTDDQLQRKITEVSGHLMRAGIRADVSTQLRVMLEALRSEYNERSVRKTIDTDPKWKPGVVLDTEKSEKEEDPLGKLINID